MKKNVLRILMLLFVSSIMIGAISASAVPKPAITDIRGGLGITVEVENFGDTPLKDATWDVYLYDEEWEVSDGLAVPKIINLDPGASRNLRSFQLNYGFGEREIVVAVYYELNGVIHQVSGAASAFVFGPFVFIK